MKIDNRFALALPIDEAWPLLSDLGRVAPLMPGVEVDEIDDEGVHARMRVKVGPVTVSYKMLVVTESLDEATHTAILKASGREVRGQGTVGATVTAVLDPADGETVVSLSTDLQVTGRVAQFGGGVMKEVADRLLGQFAQNLEQELAAPLSPADPVGTPGDEPGPAAATPPRPAAASSEPVDLGRVATAALLPRVAAPAAILALLALVVVLLRRTRH